MIDIYLLSKNERLVNAIYRRFKFFNDSLEVVFDNTASVFGVLGFLLILFLIVIMATAWSILLFIFWARNVIYAFTKQGVLEGLLAFFFSINHLLWSLGTVVSGGYATL